MSTIPPIIPTVVPITGRLPTPPATIQQNLITDVANENPGYTATLPGSLIEDISSTDVAALVVCDNAVTDSINCLTPMASNPYTLAQQGILYGVPLASTYNTSVYVVFTGTVGFIINPGFLVGDGTYQYTVQDGGVIESGGSSQPLFCLATISGTWAIPPSSVTTLITSVPIIYTLSCTNPLAGTPSAGAEAEEDYRVRVLQAGASPTQGTQSWAKTQIGLVPGVQTRLISIQQQSPGWEVIVGGGDPYAVAYATFLGMGDISNLKPSVIAVTGITQATLGVVTTNLNHGLATGQSNVYIAGVVGMTGANGGPYTVTVITPTTFTFGVNTSGFGAYVSGGVITPNPRNVSVSLYDYPDTYTIPLVLPPTEVVQIGLVWNTISPFLVSADAVAQAGAPAIQAYVNSVAVGAPMNLFELQNTFQAAVVGLIPTNLLTRMVFTVTVNGVAVSPESGTGIIPGDPESYFTCSSTGVTITQG